jgi:hypothetical protein
VLGAGFVGRGAVRAFGAAVEETAEGTAGLVDAGPALGRRGYLAALEVTAGSRVAHGQGDGRARGGSGGHTPAMCAHGGLDAALIFRGGGTVVRLDLVQYFL